MKANEVSLIREIMKLSIAKRTEVLPRLDEKYFMDKTAKRIYQELSKDVGADVNIIRERLNLKHGEALDYMNMPQEYYVEIDSLIDVLKEDYIAKEIELLIERVEGVNPLQKLSILQARLGELDLERRVEDGRVSEVLKELDKSLADNERFDFGIPKFDKMTGGLRRGQVYVVGGESGVGKSFFVLDVALKQVLNGKRVLFFSTELRRDVNLLRMGSMMIHYGNAESARQGAEMLAESDKLMMYGEITNIQDMVSEIRKEVYINGVDVVVIDHLQDIETDMKEQFETINKACTLIKNLSIKHNFGTILVSQLKRTSGDNDQKSFWGSGKIEQVAHVGAIIEKTEEGLFLKIVKNRGVVGNKGYGVGKIPIVMLENQNFGERYIN